VNAELFFEIPDDCEVMAKLIGAVPSSWAWVDGCLWAPPELVASKEAIEDTGFSLSRFHTIHPTIRGKDVFIEGQGWTKTNPNLMAILVERKLPGFIVFEEAGYQEPLITMELSKQIAIAYVRKNYGGHLSFYKDCYRNSKYDNPAKCLLTLQPWQGPPISGKEAGDQPARARLEWESRYGGKEKDIEPIIAVCHELNLREYSPMSAAA
jgi:hypothetical protein